MEKDQTISKKEKIKNRIRRGIAYLLSVSAAFHCMSVPVYAAYLEPINRLKSVALTIVGAAGTIVLIYGGVKFAESFQKKDQNGEYSAIYTIVAGGILVGISAIVTALT